MSSFMKNLPVLLNRTDTVLEVRDARLPLSSINPNFERHMASWKGKAREMPEQAPSPGKQRIVVMSKMDLVPPWGVDVCMRFLNNWLTNNE
jgi:ribosome biogenesis GTPase A